MQFFNLYISLKIIGVDYGGIRTGLAILTIGETHACPLNVIEDPKSVDDSALQLIKDVICYFLYINFSMNIWSLCLYVSILYLAGKSKRNCRFSIWWSHRSQVTKFYYYGCRFLYIYIIIITLIMLTLLTLFILILFSVWTSL